MTDPTLSEERLRLATRDAGVAIWEYDFVAGRMTRTDNHDALYGIAPQELWVYETFMNATHPEDRHLANQHIQRCMAPGGTDDYAFEFRVVWPDGSVHWLSVTGHVALRDGTGTATLFRGVIMDVTRTKAVESELRAALRLRDEFLQVASHELNTPLAALRLKVGHLAMSGMFGSRDDDRMFVERQIDKLEALIKDLLVAGRLGTDTLKLARAPVSLATIARGIVDDFAGQAKRAKCEVSLHVKSDVEGAWDKARLEQVVANLLMNALKYGAGKPVRVVVDGAQLAVEDRGPGIAPAELSRIFEKFVRAPQAGPYGGLGLGLFVAKGIVEAHGGTIHVESEEGRGARFRIELPR